ncbi:hypothetical protein, partial [Enterobacter intestinihominis]
QGAVAILKQICYTKYIIKTKKTKKNAKKINAIATNHKIPGACRLLKKYTAHHFPCVFLFVVGR